MGCSNTKIDNDDEDYLQIYNSRIRPNKMNINKEDEKEFQDYKEVGGKKKI